METIRKIKQVLAAASGAIIASPVKLPPKVVAVANFVALALGVLEAVDGGERDGRQAVDSRDENE